VRGSIVTPADTDCGGLLSSCDTEYTQLGHRKPIESNFLVYRHKFMILKPFALVSDALVSVNTLFHCDMYVFSQSSVSQPAC